MNCVRTEKRLCGAELCDRAGARQGDGCWFSIVGAIGRRCPVVAIVSLTCLPEQDQMGLGLGGCLGANSSSVCFVLSCALCGEN